MGRLCGQVATVVTLLSALMGLLVLTEIFELGFHTLSTRKLTREAFEKEEAEGGKNSGSDWRDFDDDDSGLFWFVQVTDLHISTWEPTSTVLHQV